MLKEFRNILLYKKRIETLKQLMLRINRLIDALALFIPPAFSVGKSLKYILRDAVVAIILSNILYICITLIATCVF